MNHADALEVLAVAAAFDRRTVGEADGMAWSLALPATGVEEAKSAVIQHYQRTDSWVMPSNVLAIVAEMNRTRSRDLPPVVPPRELADEPRREAQWTRVWGDAVLAGHNEKTARVLANRQFGITEDEPPLAIDAPTGMLRETLDRTARELADKQRMAEIQAEVNRQAKAKAKAERAAEIAASAKSNTQEASA